MQLVYSTASANWATRWGSLTPLQRCSQYILQPQLTRPLVRGVLSLLLRCSWCILQPQPTGTLVEGVLPLCWDAVGVFYSLSQLGHSLRESYPFAEMQLVYSTASANWATRWGSLTPLLRCGWCILQPQLTGPLVEGVLPLCWDAVGVFYSLSQLGHSLRESYPFAEMQLVYSTASDNWATRWGSLTPLQRCSWCILQPQLTESNRCLR